MIKNKIEKDNSLGRFAEDLVALEYIKKRGWKLLERNYSKPWGELDIIAKNKKKIIFIEVKALNSVNNKFFKPEEHFTIKKQERIKRASASYLLENKYPESVDYSIDLAAVEVDYSSRNAHIRYYSNAIA